MEIQRELLLSTIKKVLPAVAKKEMFDQADRVAFVGGRVVAFNDAVAILHQLPGGLDLEGSVDGRHLCALLDKLTVDVVKLVPGEGKITLSAGRSRASFNVVPVTLPIDSVDMSGELVPLPDGFVDQLKWVSASCAKDISREALTCVLVEKGWLQSSDSYRASRVRCGDAVDLPRMMLPLDQVEVLVDYAIARVSLSDGGVWVRFTTEDGTAVCVRSKSAKFPDLAHVYDVQGREIQLTSALGEAIDRARVFARRDKQIDEEVRVSMRPNQVTISARYDGGEFSETVRCEGATDTVEFSIHPKFLAAALESGTRCVLGDRSVKFSGEDWEHVVALKVS